MLEIEVYPKPRRVGRIELEGEELILQLVS
jgi:hypothetical protein